MEEFATALEYDPLTGQFTWKWREDKPLKWNRRRAGTLAGCKHTDGYIRIKLNQKSYMAHRVAWVLMTGKWPTLEIDHKNRIRTDNRWENLREVTHAENMKNVSRRSRHEGSKPYAYKVGKRFKSAVRDHDNKLRYLGMYDTAEEANQAALSALKDRKRENNYV